MTSPTIHGRLAIRLMRRTVRFLFAVLIALLVLFVVGNIRSFLDASLVFILKLLIASGVLLFLCALATFLFELYYIVRAHKTAYLVHCIMSLVAAVFGFLATLASSAVLLLSGGYQPSH